jgi:hypothetical protein
MEFSGRLAAFPPSDILQWVFNDRRTGALVVRRADRTKRIYFRRGDVVACFSDDPAEYLGQHLLLHGHLDEAQLTTALADCQKRGVRLGVALRELGLLSGELIQRVLREQIEDAVCDVFLWSGGFFYFEEDEPPTEELLPEPISTLRLAMEGARWADELVRIRRLFVHDDIVLARGPRWPGEATAAVERRVAREVDGASNLLQLYRRVNGSYFRFLAACYELAIAEVVDVAEVREDGAMLHDTGVYNLLFQQAADESRSLTQRSAVPFEVLENLVPLWLGPGPEDDSGDLWMRCDGSLPLRRLLRSAPRARQQDLEQLYLRLRQGRIVLLPRPLVELAGTDPILARALGATNV